MSNEKKQQFTKSSLLKLDKYAKHHDLLTALLDAGKTYTVEEVDAKIEKELKRKVN